MANITKKQLLVKSAIVLALAVSPTVAQADHVVTGAETTQIVTDENGFILLVENTDTLTVAGDEAVEGGDDFTDFKLIVNSSTAATEAVKSTGNFSTINLADDGDTVDAITITKGKVTGASTGAGKGTILVEGAADSYTITVDTNGAVTNTDSATGGEAIVISGANGNQTATIINNGIIDTDHASGVAISVTDASGSSTLAITNTGTISTEAGGTAINVATGGNNLTLTQNTGTITGSINVAGAGTFTGTANSGNAGTITGNITTASGALTFTQQTGGSVSGNITTTSGDADITLNGSSTVGGNVTLGSNASSSLVLAGTSSVTGNVVMDHATQAVTYGATATVTGTIDGAAGGGDGIVHLNKTLTLNTANAIGGTNGIAALNVGTGTTTTLGTQTAMTVTTLTVAGTGTLALGTTAKTITGAVTTAGGGSTANLSTGSHVVSGVLTVGATDTIASTISATHATTGAITTAGNVTAGTNSVDAGALVALTIDSAAGYIVDGATYKLVDSGAGAGGALTDDTTQITVNGSSGAGSNATTVLTFDTTTSAGNDIIIKAERTAYATAATTSNNDAVGAALNTIGVDSSGNLELIQNAADKTLTTAALNEVLDSATPQADNSLTEGVFNIVDQSIGVVDNRLSGLRSGASAGALPAGTGAWVQGFANTAEQDTTDGVTGYDADVWGVAIGADRKIRGDARVGVALSYANSNIDGKGNKSTDVDSYQVSIYGTKEYGKFYTDGLLGFAYNNFDTTRNVPSIPATATADFDGQTYTAKIGGGYVYKVPNSGLEIIPNASLAYAFNSVDSYDESGAGTADLHVDTKDSSLLQGKIGAKAGYTINTRGMKVRPEVRAAYLYDFIGDNQESTSNFSGQATTFNTEGADINKGSYNLGAGVDIASQGGYTVSADYDYEGKSDYASHTGLLRIRYDF